MRWVWAALGFVGRWLGPALIALAADLFGFPPMRLYSVFRRWRISLPGLK